MSLPRFLMQISGTALAFCSLSCSQVQKGQGPLIEPNGYVFMDAEHGWENIVTLRIVDWGDARVHMSVTDAQERIKIGSMGRGEYRRLLSDLRSLRAFELESFIREDVHDADFYLLDIGIGNKRNRISIYCPWEDVGAADVLAMTVAGRSPGSKTHAELVRILLDVAERDGLRWESDLNSFYPDRLLVNTEKNEVADVFFADNGELKYATLDYPKWAGGTADEKEGCVVWYSENTQREPQRLPFDVFDEETDYGPGPKLPRPENSSETRFPELPVIDDVDVHHLAQTRYLCDGRVGLCVRTQNGTRVIAFLVDQPSAYQAILRLDDVSVNRKQIDVAPDGSRAAWINKGRLFVSENISSECDWLLGRLESSIEN